MDDLPATAGAYALLIELSVPAAVPPSLAAGHLSPGCYVYLGSARGPGGIRARCRRHLSRPTRRHWHVDWLTAVAHQTLVLPLPGETECALVRQLLSLDGIAVPRPGFGSSDCRSCPAHLLAVSPGTRLSIKD